MLHVQKEFPSPMDEDPGIFTKIANPDSEIFGLNSSGLFWIKGEPGSESRTGGRLVSPNTGSEKIKWNPPIFRAQNVHLTAFRATQEFLYYVQYVSI